MSLRLYNTLSRKKDLFEPVRPGKVGMYLCGLTVYKSPHIGHMVGPVIFDALKRYLKFKGFDVTWVVNITDVDDKLIAAAQKAGQPMEKLVEKYTAEYLDALKAMGVDTIDQFPRATDHIPEILRICQTLVERGHAYAAGGSVYFDVGSDPDYGKLSRRKPEDEEGGQRTLSGAADKRNQADFVLWKAAKPGEPQWESPWGPGRPGWHIECSAMSLKILGQTFDIHGGGMDLLFPHHENELAQSESATGQPFARFWLHNGLTRVKTKESGAEREQLEKIGGTEITSGRQDAAAVDLKNLVSKHGAELIRYLILSTHYRSPIDFSDETIEASKKGLSGLERVFDAVRGIAGREIGQPNAEGKPPADINGAAAELLDTPHGPFARKVLQLEMKFLEMLDDDFNTAAAIGVLHEMANEIRQVSEATGATGAPPDPQLVTGVAGAGETFRKLGIVLGLFRADRQAARSSKWETALQSIRAEAAAKGHAGLVETIDKNVSREMEKGIEDFIQARADARKNKDFAAGDFIRDVLARNGYRLEDHAGGTRWSTIG